MWKGLIASIGPGTWLFIGLLANHLATVVARRIQYEKGLEELQESRHRMMLAHEHTRKEVAGLLHGRLQSRLVVVRHWLKECQGNLKGAPPEMTESLDKAADLLREISDQELQSITRQLYPSIIRTGLPSALNSLADRFRAMFFVELEIDGGMSELESPVAPKLNDSVRLTIYRVTEEALGNVAKHSEATTAYISLSFASRREMVLEIRDDGVGFDETKINLGQGLLSMEDYVTALGGTIEVSSSPGEGTSIRASVPFPSTKQQAIEQSHERMYSMV